MTVGVHRRHALGLLGGGLLSSAWRAPVFADPSASPPRAMAAPLRVDQAGLLAAEAGRPRNQRLAWTEDNAAALGSALSAASRHGVDTSAARALIDASGHRGAREAVLTRVALAYAKALSQGLADPARVFPIYTIPRNRFDAADGLRRALATNALGSWLEGLAPRDEAYGALSAAYVQALGHIGDPGPPRIPAGPVIRPGTADPRAPLIAARLGVAPSPANDPLSPQDPLTPNDVFPASDTVPTKDTLGPELTAAIKTYQRQSGLRSDGSVGSDTLAALNAGPADRARTLALNLERRRWLTRAPSPTRIDVNIPSQALVFLKDGRTAWTSRVAVGELDDPTPEIQARFNDLVVNPPWHVPASIVRKEIQARGPAYLRAHHMRWTPEGLVQAPGPWAALGLVKFDLRDPYAIYLHDTPRKGAFDDSERDLSHGCVRVEKAVDFARSLADQEGKADRFDAALASGDTHTIALAASIPVRILYHTAFADDAGQITYRPDLYRLDQRLADALGMAGLS